jgi:hypothetical protein
MTQTRADTRRAFGKYRGIVVDVDDPWSQGRIKAKVPQLLGDEVTGWALPCAPYAGDGVGIHAIPPVGAGVWIEFEGGNIDFPIWVGGWWGSDQIPEDHEGRQATPKQKTVRSETGLHVQLDDDRRVITVSDQGGDNRVEITIDQGIIRVQATQKVVVDAARIELVDRARHPLAYGDDLIQYLNQLVNLYNTHLHTGETVGGVVPVTPAPPTIPFPVATPALHSQRVTTG